MPATDPATGHNVIVIEEDDEGAGRGIELIRMGQGHLVARTVPMLVLGGQTDEEGGGDRVGQPNLAEFHRPIIAARPTGPATPRSGRVSVSRSPLEPLGAGERIRTSTPEGTGT